MEIVRYNYRLRPGSQALGFLLSEWSKSRWLWNECVHQCRSGKKPTIARLGKLLTAARAQNSWLRMRPAAVRPFIASLRTGAPGYAA